MKIENVTLNSGLMIKLLVVSFVLLTIAFGAGLFIGKSSTVSEERFSADNGEAQSKLSECSYRLQEIISKHINLTDIAKEKGLLDEKGRYLPNVVCKTRAVEVEKLSDKSVQATDTTQKAPAEPLKQKEMENKLLNEENCRYSIQIFSDPNREMAVAAQKRYDIPDLKLVEGVVNGKNWYRLRSGCYKTRMEAEQDLPEIKEIVDTAIVVAK